MGYVRLKHTLSALALDAIEHRERRSVVAWLVAYCDRVNRGPRGDGSSDAGFSQALSALEARGRAAPREIGAPVHELFDWTKDGVALQVEFRPHVAYMDRQVHRLQDALAGLRGPRQSIMRRAAALFNNGLFFECHEFLEDIWRAAAEPEHGLYHGVILIAAAFYHHEKGNRHGTRIKLRQGLAYLQPFLPRAHGIRLDRWVTRLAPWRDRIDAGRISGVLARDEIPKIPLIRSGGRHR